MRELDELLNTVAASGIVPPARALERLMTAGEAIAYRRFVEIAECGEKLVEIQGPGLSRVEPHPHRSLNAPYGRHSPFCVREGVLKRLVRAASLLSLERPGCNLLIYDAYRPLAVQDFMVKYEFTKLALSRRIDPARADDETRKRLLDEVLTIWSKPDPDPAAPPPHSTGAAIDLTIVDASGNRLDMGGDIDEIGAVSLPRHFADAAPGTPEAGFHANRDLLNRVMAEAGFRRLPHEWWHFSFGDQVWALLERLDNPDRPPTALYGRVED
ncbi:MAG: M15 family metallopeptidase [Gammaproteobacteria bacterium]